MHRFCCPDAVLKGECDILAPCALGGVITADNAPGLRAKVLAAMEPLLAKVKPIGA